MQNSQLPLKWYKPFAADDANKVEIPVTTPDPTRASQSAGFPPLTMQPPESGGVPPQGEDFNGAMNQVARVVWWMLAGGALPFDGTWAANANIGGYPQGGSVASADLLGSWLSTADNNTNNPDTVGTGWVPGYAYGNTALAGLTNANVTLTPAQAAKDTITLAGTLTGNIQVIFPNWQKNWLVVNNTTGAFSVTCKTAAGSGAVVNQGGGAQVVWGDGTNLNAVPAQRGLARYTANGSFTVPPGVTQIWISGCGGGGGGGGNPNILANSVRSGGGGGGAGKAAVRQPFSVTPGTVYAITVGAGGAGGTPSVPGGVSGGSTSIGALLTLSGGTGGGTGTQAATSAASTAGGTPGPGFPSGGVGQDASYPGASAGGGMGGSGPYGGGGTPGRGSDASAAATAMIAGSPADGFGAGGGGAGGVYSMVVSPAGGTGATGGFGVPGLVIIEW